MDTLLDIGLLVFGLLGSFMAFGGKTWDDKKRHVVFGWIWRRWPKRGQLLWRRRCTHRGRVALVLLLLGFTFGVIKEIRAQRATKFAQEKVEFAEQETKKVREEEKKERLLAQQETKEVRVEEKKERQLLLTEMGQQRASLERQRVFLEDKATRDDQVMSEQQLALKALTQAVEKLDPPQQTAALQAAVKRAEVASVAADTSRQETARQLSATWKAEAESRRAEAPAWLRTAMNEEGVAEIPGPENNPRIVEYQQATILKAKDDETPWSSAYVNWALQQAGIPITHSVTGERWQTWGVPLTAARLGCVVIYDTPGMPRYGGVSFFIAEKQEKILLLGGNVGDSVSYWLLDRNRVRGYRWPADDEVYANADALLRLPPNNFDSKPFGELLRLARKDRRTLSLLATVAMSPTHSRENAGWLYATHVFRTIMSEDETAEKSGKSKNRRLEYAVEVAAFLHEAQKRPNPLGEKAKDTLGYVPTAQRGVTMDKGKFPITVSVPDGVTLIQELDGLGYLATPSAGKAGPDDKAIWLGINVPFFYALEVLRIALKSPAELKYIDYGTDQNKIMIGASAGAARNEGCLPLPKDDEFWQKFDRIDSQLKLREFIDGYKSRPPGR